jgi:hypothetical protein
MVREEVMRFNTDGLTDGLYLVQFLHEGNPVAEKIIIRQ